MHVIEPFKGKVALVQKPFALTQLPFCVGGRNPSGQKKSLWTKIPLVQEIPGISNASGQEIPRDKKSPGTRNPPGQEIPQDKQSPKTSNPLGHQIPQEIPGRNCLEIPGKHGKSQENTGDTRNSGKAWESTGNTGKSREVLLQPEKSRAFF